MFQLDQKVVSETYGDGTVVAIDGSCNIGMYDNHTLTTTAEKYPVAVLFQNFPFGNISSINGIEFSLVFTTDGKSQGNGAII